MGEVYLAKDEKLEEFVAIKVLPPLLIQDPVGQEALKTEAKLTMKLSHPHVVKLRNFEQDGELGFLVMEYVEGATLRELIHKKGRLTQHDMLPLARQIAEALDYAHQEGVLHRDVKPSNVLVAKDGAVKVGDFGIARELRETFSRVSGRATSGTLAYMSPEQLMGNKLDSRSDVYSFGMLLYECLSGKVAFQRGDLPTQIRDKTPTPIAEIPDAANSELLRALAKQADERQESCLELVEGLERTLNGEGAARATELATPTGTPAAPAVAGKGEEGTAAAPAEVRKRRTHGLLVAVALVGGILGAMYLWLVAGGERDQPPPLPPVRYLHTFLTRPKLPEKGFGGIGLTILVAKEDVISRGSVAIHQVLAKQAERLSGFAGRLRKAGLSDELRKEMDAWAHCVCTFDTRCQGGVAPCTGCSTCEEMQGAMIMPGSGAGMDMGMEGASMEGRRFCPPKNVCLVVDKSSSMGDEDKLDRLKTAAKETLRHFMKGDVFSLVAFSSEPAVLVPATSIPENLKGLMRVPPGQVEAFVRAHPGTPAGKVLVRFLDAINSIQAEGGTNIYDAMEEAWGEMVGQSEAQRKLLQDPKAVNRILLFTDGKEYPGSLSRELVLRKFEEQARRIVRDGISISTFGIGRKDFDEELLREFVEPRLGHSGTYHYVTDAGRIYELLWNDLMLAPFAKDATLTIDLKGGVHARSVGHLLYRDAENPQRIRGNLRSLGRDQKRAASLKLIVPQDAPRDRFGRIQLARVELQYVNMTSGDRVREWLPVYVGSGEAGQNATAANRKEALIAEEEMIIQESRDALATALRLADENDVKGAMRSLREQVARFGEWGGA